MKNKAAIFFLFFVATTGAFAQNNNDIPLDPTLRTGRLKNGFTYYIKHNETPKERASFHFAQKVGAVLEKDEQQGLAHFLEHMAFNGLEHFKGKSAWEYLAKNGIQFFSEINAYTNFDSTTYNIDNVPVANPKLLDSVLLIMHDWSGSISLEDKEIDAERGVINEEIQNRDTPGQRVEKKLFSEGVFKGSMYGKRLPLGLLSVVNNFKYNELRDYYKQWYRPDLQALIVVGDVDVNEMEKKIIATFSPIPLRTNLPKKPDFSHIPNYGTIVLKSVDKELGDPELEILFKAKPAGLTGKAFYDRLLASSLASSILDHRFRITLLEKSIRVMEDISINLLSDSPIKDMNLYSILMKPKNNMIIEAFDFEVTELYRFLKYGATDDELELARKDVANRYDALKNKLDNLWYASEITKTFLTGAPLPNMEWFMPYLKQRLNSFNNEQLLPFLHELYNNKEQVISIYGNDRYTYPAASDFEAALSKAQTAALERFESIAPQQTTNDEKPLVSEPLEPRPIKGNFKLKGLDKAKGYVLANGVEFVIYPTDYEKGNIYMKAKSRGGKSLLDQSLLASSMIVTDVMSKSGLGDFSEGDLSKKLVGNQASYAMEIQDIYESLSGFSPQADLETLFQFIYLSFMKPRLEEQAFQSVMAGYRQQLANKNGDKRNLFYDALTTASSNGNKRELLLTEETLNQIDFEKVKQVHKERFNNIADFKFVFVGDIDEAQLLSLAQKYLGNISSAPARETYVDHNFAPAKGKTLVHMSETLTPPQASVIIALLNQLDFNQKNLILVEIIRELLSKKYTEVLRESEGGTYFVRVEGNLSKAPKQRADIGIYFNCNPDKADRFVEITYKEIEKLQTNVDQKSLDQIKTILIKKAKEQPATNQYWIDAVISDFFDGTPYVPTDKYIKQIQAITPQDVKEIATKLNNKPSIIEGILRPKP